MTYFQPGALRIATLSPADQVTKLGTFYLPSPNRSNGLAFEWIEKSLTKELIDGSESTRRFGFIPQVTLSWSIYDDLNPLYGYPIGSATGNQLSFPALLAIMDITPGFIRFSPSTVDGGFNVYSVKIAKLGVTIAGLVTGLSITLRGGEILPTKVLGAF